MPARNIGIEILVACLVIYVALIRLAEANSETDALYALRQSLTDPNEALKSWDPSLVNPCTWFHITCNQDNQVTRVDLIKYDLSGNLVPDLGNLQNLQYLELQGNKIQGTIPPELGNLKNLISLDLYDNALTGNIPPSLGNLNSLIFLRLQNNQLTGRVPDEIKRLHLKVLDVSGNPGLTPSSANMDLTHANLSGHLVPELGNLTDLQYLDLTGNNLKGTIPSELGNLKNLIGIYFDHNRLTGSIPPSLGNLGKLRYLWLNDNQLTGRVPDEIKRMGLMVLNVTGNPLSG